MNLNDAAEPAEWDLHELRRSFEEWESVATHILVLLHASFDRTQAADWRPHLEQIERAVVGFRDFCLNESEQLGLWREDCLQPGEVYKVVWDEGDRLVKWWQ